MPVDFSAHWLMLTPFGQDSRYDGVSAARDKPKFRPQAAPMQLRASSGYRTQKLRDPSDMVFKEKFGS